MISEDDVWGRRELGSAPVDLASARSDFRQLIFERRSADPTGEAVGLFSTLLAKCHSAGELWLQDWTWPDLIALMWVAPAADRIALSRRLRVLADPVGALILYLDVRSEVAVARALAERGPAWFNRHFHRPLSAPVVADDIRAGAAQYEQRRTEHLDFILAAGWRVRHLDGEQSASVVADHAVEELGAD